ncbi:MAG: DUF308 domain-containing protein [Promethearchaeota archaeon]
MAETGKEAIPIWMRLVEVIIGILAIVLAIIIFLAPTYLNALIFVLAMCAVIAILGLGLIYRGFIQKERTWAMRFLMIIGGIILIILGIYLFFDLTLFAALLLVWIFGIALAIDGIVSIVYALGSLRLKNWQRWALFIIGAIEAILALFAVVVPLLGINIFSLLIVVALIMGGIAYILAGLTGERYVPQQPSAMGKE